MSLALAAVLTLAGCAPQLQKGEIVAKDHDAAYTSIILVYCGKGCMRPQPIFHPERWQIELQGPNPSGEHETITDWIDVTEETYNAYEVGDVVDFTPTEGAGQ